MCGIAAGRRLIGLGGPGTEQVQTWLDPIPALTRRQSLLPANSSPVFAVLIMSRSQMLVTSMLDFASDFLQRGAYPIISYFFFVK